MYAYDHGLIQPKNESGYRFWARNVWHPNSTFLACLYCQKQLKTKILIKYVTILIHRKRPVLESRFNGLKAWNFIKETRQHRCFPGKFTKFLRTCFFTENLQWLLPSLSIRRYLLSNLKPKVPLICLSFREIFSKML